MLPEASPSPSPSSSPPPSPPARVPPLPRRIPGEADLRVFTSEHLGGRHRFSRERRRVVRDPSTGQPKLRLFTVALLVLLSLLGCTSGSATTGSGGQVARLAASGGDRLSLRNVCPKS